MSHKDVQDLFLLIILVGILVGGHFLPGLMHKLTKK